MTYSGGKPHTDAGDRGQRYEVRFVDGDDGRERVLGWTEDATGGALVKGIEAHPSWHSPRVIDRHAEKQSAPSK